ncbi:PQQ-dependent sugar dehydrogenase [Arenicella xantha]|uniref:Glucose/arabinose dehydrogenase n=1 Tax=Arenicella xantha TaxID=644221 RepID=A0A395JKU6_9GAMM|nr:PQQ-dependent sugar dehydrogenase [Arenicella xantha]RBP49672.1 glucose/arabinose dehydrogenase [Arenicella xantha]
MIYTKELVRRASLTALLATTLMLSTPVGLHAASASPIEPNSTISTLVTGLDSPWAMAFLPNGDILITERAGKIRVVRNNTLLPQAISGIPAVYFAGQGGLLDILLDRNFSENNKLYLSYAVGTAKQNATRLISAELHDGELINQNVLFTGSPMRSTAHHFAGRIAQLSDGTLLLTVGDGFNYREHAQRLDSHLGKIIRVDQQGKPPADNPFIDTTGAKPEIWSLGHRNHQGMVVVADRVFANEHGPKGGDEINRIKPGLNYGWPIITRGVDYTGARISPFTDYPDMQQPLVDWTPSIAPSSMTYLKGYLYSTSLAEGSIRQTRVENDTLVDEGIVVKELRGRLRDIEVGPDGNLYVLTDGQDARLIKIQTAK